MTAEAILTTLVRLNLVASVAILLVLALRPFVLRWFGARVTYWFWLVVPIAASATFIPAREQIVLIPPYARAVIAEQSADAVGDSLSAPDTASARVVTTSVSVPKLADVLVALWLIGAGALLTRSIVSTRRFAADPSAGPALVGVLRPRLVLPADFATRFDAEERALILAHEDVHRVSGHTVVNALVEVARCASWFNPFVHLAAIRIRTDQELACDAAVIAASPTNRRVYAQALLKTQIAPAFLPLGCTWTSPTARRIKERIAMLGRPSLSRRSVIAGAAAVAIVGVASGYTAWAQQPERLVTATATQPEAVWTPAAAAPAGALAHALEGQRHDHFIELAQRGDIDVVFFGATTTEMWSWPQRGKDVWDRDFGALKAANFGSQGTHPDSLVWRMQNGELDGYQAKLVVLHAFNADRPSPARSHFGDWPAGYAAVIAEIRARQPQAKILIFAAFHREQTLREWREVAAANAAAFAGLVDDETVFYDDYGERFYLPDGSFKPDMWRATEPALYEMWAEELQPWLDRFVR